MVCAMVKKIFHRLKIIRNELGLSREAFAELLGDGWYVRKIERLENGSTRMNENTADEISQKLNIPFEQIWVEPEEKILGEKMQSKYIAAPDHIQKTINDLLNLSEEDSVIALQSVCVQKSENHEQPYIHQILNVL